MIKPLCILLLSLTLSCSKGGSGSGGPGSPGEIKPPTVVVSTLLKNGFYLNHEEDLSVPYRSKKLRAAVLADGYLIYTLSLVSDYSLDKEGNPRTGSHPDNEAKVIFAEYKVEKGSDEKMKLIFQGSSCNDANLNPFPELSSKEMEFIEDNEALSFIANGSSMEILLKSDEATFNGFVNSYKIKQVYCPGESVL